MGPHTHRWKINDSQHQPEVNRRPAFKNKSLKKRLLLRGNKLIFKRPSVPKIWSRSVLGSTSVNVTSQLSPLLITLSLGTALEQGPLTFRINLRRPGFTAQAFYNGLPVDLREVSKSDMANGAARTSTHTRGRDSVLRQIAGQSWRPRAMRRRC